MSSTNLILKLARKLLLSLFLLLNLPAQALEGGQPANYLDYPGLVMLSYDDIPNTFNFKNCSGIILEPRRILTSASCVHELAQNPIEFIPIPANKIHIHLPSQGRIGPFQGFELEPSDTPSFRISSYVVHPQNPFSGGHHNLAIIYLNTSLSVAPALVYNGSDKFIGSTGTAIGWNEEESGGFPLPNKYFALNKLSFSLIDGNTDIDSYLCYDNFVYTGTVFCGGYRNSVKFLATQDEGAPIYRNINGKQAAIGLLVSASNGLLFDNGYLYERYARISSMVDFIKQHAPNTQFWNESSEVAEPDINIIPMLQLLLLTK